VTGCLATCIVVASCSSNYDSDADATREAETTVVKTPGRADLVKPDKGTIVIRAKYYRTKGPCIRIGDAWAMPVVDGFEVVQVVSGTLQATFINVRPLSGGGPAYPKELAEGKIYTLRITPSEQTKKQLLENEKEGWRALRIDGDEIEEKKPGK